MEGDADGSQATDRKKDGGEIRSTTLLLLGLTLSSPAESVRGTQIRV